MVSTLFRDPQALSSDLASLGTLQPRAFGSLNRVETLDSASNYYIIYTYGHICACMLAIDLGFVTRQGFCTLCLISLASSSFSLV